MISLSLETRYPAKTNALEAVKKPPSFLKLTAAAICALLASIRSNFLFTAKLGCATGLSFLNFAIQKLLFAFFANKPHFAMKLHIICLLYASIPTTNNFCSI